VDVCDEVSGCVNDPDDGNCPDDGMFCNGSEFCDPLSDCVSSGDPCPLGTVCNEGADLCDPVVACGDGILDPGEDCDDGNQLDGDCCSANCQFEPMGSPCADAAFCNGEETCDGAGSCRPGVPVDCDDGVDCTVDACDEVNGCVNDLDDAFCDDGAFCNGVETCDPVNGCQPGTPVDCSDGVDCTVDGCDEVNDECVHDPFDPFCNDGEFCTGVETCDPVNDCSSSGDPCPAGTVCNEGTDMCDPVTACGDGILDPGEDCDDGNQLDGDCCSANCQFEPMGSPCADAEFCNGEETCDGAGACQAGLPVDCDDGVDCTADACDEVNDECVSTANDNLCADDQLFCTGQEICDVVQGCVSTGDPCPSKTTCNEDTDTCDPTADKGKVRGQPSGPRRYSRGVPGLVRGARDGRRTFSPPAIDPADASGSPSLPEKAWRFRVIMVQFALDAVWGLPGRSTRMECPRHEDQRTQA
jgi:cysteine-rich repeat protein